MDLLVVMKSYSLSTIAILYLLCYFITQPFSSNPVFAHSMYDFSGAQLQMPCPGGSGVIGGQVFQDFNYNGLDDQSGIGLAGIEVFLFTCGPTGTSSMQPILELVFNL